MKGKGIFFKRTLYSVAAVRLLNVFQNQPLKLALTGISLVAKCVWNWDLDSALSLELMK